MKIVLCYYKLCFFSFSSKSSISVYIERYRNRKTRRKKNTSEVTRRHIQHFKVGKKENFKSLPPQIPKNVICHYQIESLIKIYFPGICFRRLFLPHQPISSSHQCHQHQQQQRRRRQHERRKSHFQRGKQN